MAFFAGMLLAVVCCGLLPDAFAGSGYLYAVGGLLLGICLAGRVRGSAFVPYLCLPAAFFTPKPLLASFSGALGGGVLLYLACSQILPREEQNGMRFKILALLGFIAGALLLGGS